MNYFKCVLSAFNITIKRKRTYNRSRFPYIQSSTSEAVLSTRSNIKYLVRVNDKSHYIVKIFAARSLT